MRMFCFHCRDGEDGGRLRAIHRPAHLAFVHANAEHFVIVGPLKRSDGLIIGHIQRQHRKLAAAGLGTITTEIEEAPTVYFAEAYHQQYLAKNPQGYCGIGGTGVTCPI